MAERLGVRCTRRLLNTCLRERTIPESSKRGVDSPCMEKKGRCPRPWKISRYHVIESCSECVRKKYGWKDKEDGGV